MLAALLTPTEAIQPDGAATDRGADELAPRAEDVQNVEPADGLGGRDTDNQTPTPTHVESEGDTI